MLKQQAMYSVWLNLYNISYLLLLYPRVVQTFSWALRFQTPVIYIVLNNCNLQDSTNLFKLERKYAMSGLASLLTECNESHLCDQEGPSECRSGIGSIR